MFSVDEFHPSAAGYAAAAAVLLPSVADAVGVWPAAADRGCAPIRRDTVRPVAQAAARAASRPGTEVQAAEVARLGHRPPRALGAAAPPPARRRCPPPSRWSRSGGGTGRRLTPARLGGGSGVPAE